LPSFDFRPRTRVIFAKAPRVARHLAREAGFARTLIVSDRGIVATGYTDHAATVLAAARHSVVLSTTSSRIPNSHGRSAGPRGGVRVDSIVAIGGAVHSTARKA